MSTELRAFRALTVAFVVLAAAAAAAPASAQYYYDRDHTLRFRGGLFEPDGESEYWRDAEATFTGDASEFEDVLLGFDYRLGLGRGDRLGLLLSASGFEGDDRREDLDFTFPGGAPITHRATLEVTALTAGLIFDVAPRAPVRPYVGAGGGYYLWDLEEAGDFVFIVGGDAAEVFTETFRDDGATLGYFWLVGVDVPITENWTVFAEGRWHRADDDLGGDFENFGELDLSGREISGGVSWTF